MSVISLDKLSVLITVVALIKVIMWVGVRTPLSVVACVVCVGCVCVCVCGGCGVVYVCVCVCVCVWCAVYVGCARRVCRVCV